ncbi:MAG: WG repeat-containing protein [Bacteroidaceae bacterium]|nr:WG repeat-containing protein [Bacteroidaceae bacterium]
MRYTVIKSPITKKYYICDSEEKKMSSEKGFDIILEIVQDKIAIVGRADIYQSGYYYYSTYKYQLVDVKGRPISEREFDFVYPYDSFIICKNKGVPVNKLSYLDDYIWDNELGVYLSKYPFYMYDFKNAIVKGEYWYESYKGGYWYQYIDAKGNVLKEAKVESKESVERVLFGFRKQDFSNLVYIDVLADNVDKRWGRINELARRTDDKYFNICDFNLSEKYDFHNVEISFAWGEFLILIKMEENPSYTGYDKQPKYKEGKCIAILNDSFDVIYYSKDGFDIYPRTFHNRIIINREYILCPDGRLFNLPENIKFDEFYSDNCGFAEIEKDNKIGFMNNEGHIVIPPIFPKDVQTGIDEEAANESWREYQKYAADSVSDAFDGEPDAYWNID